MPLIEICKGLRGQQIHCTEGATCEHDPFDLSMALVSNKLTSNRGYLLWLGAICAGIINWSNSSIYGKMCALSSFKGMKVFVESKSAVQGFWLRFLWLNCRMMDFQEKSTITFSWMHFGGGVLSLQSHGSLYNWESRGAYCKQKSLHYGCLNTSVTLQSIKGLSWTATSSFSPDACVDVSFSLKPYQV